MANWKSFSLESKSKVAPYVLELFQPEDAVLAEIRERSAAAGLPPIHVGSMDARHLEVLVRMTGGRRVVEIGTLGGYSGVSLLKGMPQDGRLLTFEYSEKHAQVARESFRRAGYEGQVELFIGPALENLPQIVERGPFDLVFIDANKGDYPLYLEWAAQNLREGGVVIGDNTFAFGHLADDPHRDHPERAAVVAMQAFNTVVAKDPRFRGTIIPTGEGLTVAVRTSWGLPRTGL